MAQTGALNDFDCEGTLTIASTSLNTPAWAVYELWNLWGVRGDFRTAIKTLPYAQGSVVYPTWRNGLRLSLPMIITGHVNASGVAFADPMAGLATNLATLSAVVMPPDPTSAITRTISVVRPAGATLSGTCVPLGLTPGQVQLGIMRATLELLIPDGRLT